MLISDVIRKLDETAYITAFVVDHPVKEAIAVEPISSVLAERLGDEWIVLRSVSGNLSTFNFRLGVSLSESPVNGWILSLKFSDDFVSVRSSSRSFTIKWKGDRSVMLLASEIASLALHSFRNPLLCLERKLIVATVFYLNPHIWSEPSIAGSELATAFSLISKGLDLKEKYISFVKALHFLSQLDHLPEFLKALKALAALGIAPPLSKRDLFYIDQLSPMEIKVLNALTSKEAVDRIQGIGERSVVSLLSELLNLRLESFDKRRLLKSLSQRQSKEGLTLSEISHLLGVDKAYLWRYVLPRMAERFLIIVGSDRYRGRTVKVYRPNVSMPVVGDMVLNHTLNLSYLIRGRK